MKTRILVALLAVAALGACNDDGRTLRAAPPPTAPPVETPIFTDSDAAAAAFSLSSSALAADGTIDSRFTCDGDGDFMPLTISGVAPDMVELAVLVVDESADEYVHWVASSIPASTTTLDPSIGFPAELVLGTTSGDVTGWEPPCPPPGETAHRYRFSLYAFAEPVGMQPGLPGHDAVAVLPQSSIGYAEMIGYYGR